ncbi:MULTISPECIES: protein kinase domain-containing protein [unclassified Pseudofrankia]|uniref:protein kinase domain-containing protein n=1 Tax=unclassified Pseudofrankia TaxID=2994372 RepID=UPI0008DA3D22|nr:MULTISPECIES: protein kinase [unclassified Pseudofrankia]MDT3440942.1 protein kinase [Pseudofrankia sp. BMG5.37]OHV45291.1 serine/threonine protein kinase [Pseudofrankia sp. BMG5.36]
MLTPLGRDDPSEIGPYRIQSLIGRGGMGAVYLGFSPADKAVAVKVPSPALARDDEFRGRFRREVDAARRVHGRAVAAVLDADTDDERPWMATEYVEGASLAEAVAGRGRLDERLVAGLAVGLAEALVAIHAAGVVHRDLKPANILLSWDGPRVIDFGVASASGATQHTSTGMLVGTIVWMAPEQLRGERAGPAADIFAWGACVAYAAAGRAPFHADNPQAIALKIMNEPPDLSGVPASLLPMVRAALDKNAASRPSAAELRDRLLRGVAAADTATRAVGDDRYATALARLWELPSPPPGQPSPPPGQPGAPYQTPPGPYPLAGYQHSPPPRPAYGPSTPPPAYGGPPGAGYGTSGYGGGYGGSGYRDPGYPAGGAPAGSWARQPARPAPVPPPRRRSAGTVVLVVAFVLLLGGAAAVALALANRGDGGSPDVSASTAGVTTPADSGAPTGPSTSGGPSTGGQGTTPGGPSPTRHLLTAQEVSGIVDGEGYRAEMNTFDRNRDLNVVIGTRDVPGGDVNGNDTTEQLAFVFANGEYIGTDLKDPSRHIEVVQQTPSYVVLEYGVYDVPDGDCCPSSTVQIRYNWDGKSFRPQNESDIPTSDPSVDGSRR